MELRVAWSLWVMVALESRDVCVRWLVAHVALMDGPVADLVANDEPEPIDPLHRFRLVASCQ